MITNEEAEIAYFIIRLYHGQTVKLGCHIPFMHAYICNTVLPPFDFLCKIGDFEIARLISLQNKVC